MCVCMCVCMYGCMYVRMDGCMDGLERGRGGEAWSEVCFVISRSLYMHICVHVCICIQKTINAYWQKCCRQFYYHTMLKSDQYKESYEHKSRSGQPCTFVTISSAYCILQIVYCKSGIQHTLSLYIWFNTGRREGPMILCQKPLSNEC